MRASDESLTTALALVPPMMGQPATAMLRCCYASADEAAAAAALPRSGGSRPVAADEVRVVPYAGVLDEAPHAARPAGADAQRLLPAAGRRARRGRRGAVPRRRHGGTAQPGRRFRPRPADATAFAHRDARRLARGGDDAAPRRSAGSSPRRRWPPGPRVAAAASGAYAGFLGPATDAEVAAAYPAATYRRLAAVKRRYDPGNVFRRNHNIRPERADAVSAG